MYTVEELNWIIENAVIARPKGGEVVFSKAANLLHIHFVALAAKRTRTPEEQSELDFLRPFYYRLVDA